MKSKAERRTGIGMKLIAEILFVDVPCEPKECVLGVGIGSLRV